MRKLLLSALAVCFMLPAAAKKKEGKKESAAEQLPAVQLVTAEDSAIAKYIASNGGRGGIQHIAFAVEDGVANALAEAEGKGVRLIDKAPRKGAEGLNIAFLHPKSTCGALVELCEDPNKK